MITDFDIFLDRIDIDNAVFAGLAAGALAVGAFRVNLTGLAQDADDRVIYDIDDRDLYFDADGTGAGGRVRFAELGPGLAPVAADFFVV